MLLPTFIVGTNVAHAQKTVSTKKQNKKNRDTKGREEEKKADMKSVEKELTKKHMKIQAKQTKKMMKKSAKKSKRLKAGKKQEPFYKRWFRKG